MAGNSRTKTCRRPKVNAPAASATEVNNTSPSGIIPTIDATVPRMARFRSWPRIMDDTNRATPNGIIANVSALIIRLIMVNSWLAVRRCCFAEWANCFTKLPWPTVVAWTAARPARITLPEVKFSPVTFMIGVDSPVIWDSSTSNPVVCRISASTGSWSPRPISKISSWTMSSCGCTTILPARRIRLLLSDNRANLSTCRFERISWKIPIAVLTTTTPKNSRFL